MKRANKSKRLRVVALLGNQLHHKNSLSIYLKGNLNIVGAVYCNSKTNGLPLEYIKIRIRKVGFLKVFSQIISRIIYLARNRSFDKNLYHQIFCESDIKEIIRSFNLPVKNCSSYSQSEVITWIKELKPDILLCHTGEWVSKKVRTIKGVKYVIGGHPGITQKYRGVHSPFWAIYNKDISSIGWTTFIIDSEVDAGEIIDQGYIKTKSGNSFFSLSWICMNEIAHSHVNTINSLSEFNKLLSFKNNFLSEKTLYDLPGFFELIRYWLIQKEFR